MNSILCFFILLALPVFLLLLKIPRWSPVYVFSIFWWLQFSVCYLLFPRTPWALRSISYIVLCTLVLSLGFVLFYYQHSTDTVKKIANNSKILSSTLNFTKAKAYIWLLIILGLCYAILSIKRSGFSLSAFVNFDSFLQMHNDIAVARYNGTEIKANLFIQFFASCLYAAPIAGGSFFPYARNKKERALSFLPFFPILLGMFTENTKAGFIAAGIFWISGYFTSYTRLYGKIKISFKNWLKIGAVAVLSIFMLFSVMIFRIGKVNSSTIETVSHKFLGYTFGHVAAIDDWLRENLFHSDWTLGQQTFIGISRYITSTSRQQGVYQDYYIGPYFSTNVYSYFRGIYQDFGLLGSLLFFALCGCLIGYCYRRIRLQPQGQAFSESVVALSYMCILFFYVSLFSYASFILAIILFYFYLWIAYNTTIKM